MEDCLFCKIASKKIPAFVVYEDDKVLAFLDIAPRAAGHTLVIPKRHAPTLADLPEMDVEPLFLAVQKISKLLVAKLKADGMTLGINQGAVSGQVVGHLHVHLLPRFADDGGGAIQSVVHHPSDEALEKMRERIADEDNK